ncbi:MAG: hypothetical protein AB7S26_24605 [Sandaracinaceae bacterium]
MLFRSILASVLLAGCYQSHPCAGETCNAADDDCDGMIDEDFVDDDGFYLAVDNCGECGVVCQDVFPTASEVACERDDARGAGVCVLVACAEGFHRADQGSCAPDVPVLCLPCEADADCALRVPGARCLETGSGQTRCGQPCGSPMECPDGFSCTEGQCAPDSGWCACDATTEGAEIACLLEVAEDGHACVGVQRCGADGPGPCEPALSEACDGQDDDCDRGVDEDFRDEEGRYVARLHCGGCAIPCVEPGPNMLAECLPDGAGVRCDIDCLEGFVDVDRILANGCECERWTGMGPPPAIGGDSDCDGVPDDTDLFIYVTTMGSDTNPGTLARPMRTLNAALSRGRTENKSVLVARGIYDGPMNVLGGVSIFGGYSPDFTDRDLELFPVTIERRDPGLPVVVCQNVTAATQIDGFTLMGSDAVGAGEGSTTMYLDGCGPAVSFSTLEIFAGRGSDGDNGVDSSARLGDWGVGSLAELDGGAGANGAGGTPTGGFCSIVAGGPGATHLCRMVDVSGGSGGAASCVETGCTNGRPCGNAGCVDFTVGGVCDFAAVLAAATPNPAPGAGRGPMPGDAGVLTYNAPTDRGVCNFCDDNPTLPRDSAHGGDGGSGSDGLGGQGCITPPALDPADGVFAGGGGTIGTDGTDGSGGGGASAGAGYDVIGGTAGTCSDQSGGSGGGGGAGGCGAPGATGGGGGGVSAGVVVRFANGSTSGPSFSDVRIVTASGGRGGDGGVGADGGNGGSGGNGGVGRHWCARNGGRGGDGGRGGAGGGGGGGCGGGSHGVVIVTRMQDAAAYQASLAMSLTIDSTGVAGRGGRGGFSPGLPGTSGSDGAGQPILTRP